MTVELVTVATFPTAAEAETVRGILEAEGVPCVLADSALMSSAPFFGMAVGQVGLRVDREQSGRAAEILRRLEEEAAAVHDAAEVDPEKGENACVSCGAPFPEYLERCPACGLSYS
ncbi:MAG: DUF2007 domain-containing protein [Planctomycetaceae bacterium]|nr:DUF2007 domain-containing protein [Planctomycetota bacterium]NUN53249.1 DUF2007 domain-containing protein [Planctomycetaceae bacterium]